eukprot:5819811-Lingulodinium_polyedra.AAC.1
MYGCARACVLLRALARCARSVLCARALALVRVLCRPAELDRAGRSHLSSKRGSAVFGTEHSFAFAGTLRILFSLKLERFAY